MVPYGRLTLAVSDAAAPPGLMPLPPPVPPVTVMFRLADDVNIEVDGTVNVCDAA